MHRIDRLTSGLVLVAKTPEAERRLSADFQHRKVHKEYLVLLAGEVAPARFAVNCPVVPGRKGKMRAGPAPRRGQGLAERPALTEFTVLERWPEVTLVLAVPRTGKTHQIRVHAWAAGYPVAIDPVYARGCGRQGLEHLPGIDRLPLHAYRYTLPETWEKPRSFECPLTDDFTEALRLLRLQERQGKR